MITTHDGNLAATMKTLCLHGISKDAWNRYADRGHWYYQVLAPGFKYNLSDIQSAIGVHQLRKLERFVEVRTRYAQLYGKVLGDVAEIELPPDRDDCRHAWHLYTLRLNLDRLTITRDEFITEMQARGVGTSVHFIPIPLHPFFAPYSGRPENHCPEALALYPRLVSLPLYPGMTEAQVEYVAETTKQIVRANRKDKFFVTAPGTGRVEYDNRNGSNGASHLGIR
jgi:perosamine synthetase